MKALIIDLEPYREKAVNEARQARLDERIARRNAIEQEQEHCEHCYPQYACDYHMELHNLNDRCEIGGYPWRNITTDEALEHIRKEGLK